MRDSLTRDAIAIWNAGLDAVRGDRLLERLVSFRNNRLIIESFGDYDLSGINRIIVLGAGKATSAMARGLETAFERDIGSTQNLILTGFVNVPEGTFSGEESKAIYRHAARPRACNEPTEQGVLGSKAILDLAHSAQSSDLVLCLISGGASALLPFPIEGISLEDKLAVTRLLSRQGATIEELNEVRRALSQIKGGGLARACSHARFLLTIVLSDVLGDPLPLIGSGPTINEPPPDPKLALSIVKRFDRNGNLPDSIEAVLRRRAEQGLTKIPSCPNDHFVVANNATAVDAAGVEAVKRGYAYLMESSPRSEGPVDEVATHLVQKWKLGRIKGNPNCIISGGEPTVQLPPPSLCGKGGRNQQLALKVLDILSQDKDEDVCVLRDMAMISAGTDGEDGPTDAAGAILNANIARQTIQLGLDSRDFLTRCDAYDFFQQTGGLFMTGPTNTNVCDLRVALVDQGRR